MPFEPNVEKLIRPIRVEKPQEEFLLPGSSAQIPVEPPEPVTRETPFLPPESPVAALINEAGRVQELIDMLVETTPNIEVSIPEEDQALLGARTVTTQEYVAAANDNSPDAVRRRHHFEWGLLQGCGATSSPHWPILGLPDLHTLQGDLLNATSIVEGEVFRQTTLATKTPKDWQAAASGSHLQAVNQALVESSRSYRLKLAQATFTVKQDATSHLLEKLISPLLNAELTRLRPVILEVLTVLKALRNLFCHAQFIRAMEYRSVRDALLSALEAALLKQLLTSFLVLLGQAENALIRPVLHMFEHGLGDGPLLAALGDRSSLEIAAVAGSTMLSLKRRYNDQAADLIRAVDKRSQDQLLKLHVLGERNLINRWVHHLDLGIMILRGLLSQNTVLSRQLAEKATTQILRHLEPVPSPLVDRLGQHPELSLAQGTPLVNREFVAPPLTNLEGQVRGSFGDLKLTNFQPAGDDAPTAPSFTGVDPAGP